MVDTYLYDQGDAELRFGEHERLRMAQMEHSQWQPFMAAPSHLAHRQRKKSKKPIEEHEHYIAIVYDAENDRYIERSSASIPRKLRHQILADAGAQFSHHMQINLRAPRAESTQGIVIDDATDDTIRTEQYSEEITESENRPSRKRKVQDDNDSDHSSNARRLPAPQRSDQSIRDHNIKQVEFRADATAEWEKWFNDAFRAVQQVCCRTIAKEWIKTIHPKKQSTNPYNGKNPSTGQKGDSDSTKPSYWPRDVIHREPDHINKEARTKLLVHLLMNTPHNEVLTGGEIGREINAQTLKDRLDQKAVDPESDLRKKWLIIEDIIDVRSRLENFEEGGLPGEAVITTRSYSDYGRGNKQEDDDSDDEGEAGFEPVSNDDTHLTVEKRGSSDCFSESAPSSVLYTKSESEANPDATIHPPNQQLSRAIRYSQRHRSSGNPIQMVDQAYPQHQPPHETNLPPYMHGIHPPMLLTGRWDSPTSLVSPEQGFPQLHAHTHNPMLQSPNSMHSGYISAPWLGPIQPGADLASQFDQQMMVTGGSIPSTIPHQSPYLGDPFHPTSHPQYSTSSCEAGCEGGMSGMRPGMPMSMGASYHQNMYDGQMHQNADEQIRAAYY